MPDPLERGIGVCLELFYSMLRAKLPGVIHTQQSFLRCIFVCRLIAVSMT